MTETPDPDPAPAPAPAPPAQRSRSWLAAFALVVALAALAAAIVPLPGIVPTPDRDRGRGEEIAKTQRRLSLIDDRIRREREERERLVARLGIESGAEDSLAGRLARVEARLDELPGEVRGRSMWMLERAEYFLRMANAQQNLVGDSASALTALEIADEHLREAGDPRLAPVRRIIATEIAALRSLPKVDTEGLALRIGTLAESIAGLPRRQSAPQEFRREAAPVDEAVSGLERAWQSLRNALGTIVSVRRSDAPPATLLSDESAGLLVRSIELDLQLARLALVRGETQLYRATLDSARRRIEQYYDASAPTVAAALATLDELASVPLPESRPDVSASLAELLKFREAQAGS